MVSNKSKKKYKKKTGSISEEKSNPLGSAENDPLTRVASRDDPDFVEESSSFDSEGKKKSQKKRGARRMTKLYLQKWI